MSTAIKKKKRKNVDFDISLQIKTIITTLITVVGRGDKRVRLWNLSKCHIFVSDSSSWLGTQNQNEIVIIVFF